MNKNNYFNVAIIGGGISGTSLMYTLAKYSDVGSVALFEKYDEIASVNSNAKSNSQTLHCGDIETNYTLQKAAKVKKTANMLKNYALNHGYNEKYIFKFKKMALGVGEDEVAYIKKRFEEFKELYPYMELWDENRLAELEPALTQERKEPIAAMGVMDEYTAVDFGSIAKSFVENAKEANENCELFLNHEIERIEKIGDKFHLFSKNGENFFADYVIVDAGAHSLLLAHEMGYGLEYSALPIGGSFFFSNKDVLNSKVYTVQNPKLPFAAVHGDPDIIDGRVRFGPTALALPKLERYHSAHFVDFLESLNPDPEVFEVFYDLVKDEDIRDYIAKNFMYEIPGIRRKLFVKEIKKIVPTLTSDDIEYAEGIGGLRPQVIDKVNKKLLLGEAKIDKKDGIVFNMTPSPGATSCLGNAYEDAKIACDYLGKKFKEYEFNKDLVER